MQKVLEQGLGKVVNTSAPDSPLKNQIMHKLDLSSKEDSLVELWTNLERQKQGKDPLEVTTQDDVNEALNPGGQLSDYDTQRTIRYNTYSGIALTGISANFGKVMGYLFGAEAPSVISNGTEDVTVGSGAFKELLKTNGVASLDELLVKNKAWKVSRRNDPLLKASHHFKINGQTITGFTREERRFFRRQQPTNIFETIDTIINLAIDNVKEGKLHILGITNSNANAYLAMVGMGIPINVVSRIFKTPIMSTLNEGGRWVARNINRNELKDTVVKLMEASDAERLTALEEYLGSEEAAKIMPRLDFSSVEAAIESVKVLPIRTEALDGIYTGKISGLQKAFSDAAVLSTTKKLIPVGEQMFSYAQAFSLLRGMPSKKWKLESIIDKIEKLVKFEGEEVKKEEIFAKYKEEALDYFKGKDPLYQTMAEQNPEAADKYAREQLDTLEGNKILYGTPAAAARASFVNRLIRKTVDAQAKASPDSVFEDNVITRLPHVMAAYRAAVQLRTLIEKAFRMHSPAVRRFAEMVVDRANIFSPFDKLEKTDAIQKEAIKFLASNLTFDLQGQQFSTSVPYNTEAFATSTVIVHGVEAWAQRLISTINKLNVEGNEFLDSLETPSDEATGLRKLKIIANKINDDEIVEQIREDFRKLAAEHPEVARDIFKYAILTEGMYYERTGLALVFPDEWAAEFSQALEQRIDSVIPMSDPIATYNLEQLADSFLYQFARNNPSFIGYPRDARAEVTGSFKNSKGYTEKIYSGQEAGVGFDLKYNGDTEHMPLFVTFFSKDIYLRLDAYTPNTTYYAKIIEGANHTFYDFSPANLEDSLDLNKLSGMPYRMLNALRLNGSTYTGVEGDLFIGQYVLVFDKSAPNLRTAKLYTVKSEGQELIQRGQKLYKYQLEFVRNADLTKGEATAKQRQAILKFLPERLGNTIPINDPAEFKQVAASQPYARLLTSSSLGIKPLTEDMSKAEVDGILQDVFSNIEKLDKDLTYYVDTSILSPLDSSFSSKRKVAEALFNKIRYRDQAVRETLADEQRDLGRKAQIAILENEIVTATVKAPELITELTGSMSTHSIPREAVYRKGWKQLVPGMIIKLGVEQYGYVDQLTKDKAEVTMFGPEVFLSLEEPVTSKEAFENAVLKNSPC